MTAQRSETRVLEALLWDEYGLRGELSRLAGESENFLLVTPLEARYVLKLCTEFQTSAMLQLEHLAVGAAASSLGIALPTTVLTRRGSVEAVAQAPDGRLRGRLLRFVAGTPWCEAESRSPALRRATGRLLGRLAGALAEVDQPAARRTHPWDLTAALSHRPKVARVAEPSRRRLLERAFDRFEDGALPHLAKLPKALIHGDLNDENLLVTGDEVTGLLDFGDCLHNPQVCELAIALAYLLFDEATPLEAGAEIVAGYREHRTLLPEEIEALFPLICGRLATSVAIAAERRTLDPTRTAWFVTEEPAWRALERYLAIEPAPATETLAGAKT